MTTEAHSIYDTFQAGGGTFTFNSKRMIKCNVTVCGIVSREAAVRTDKEGKQFVTFGIDVVIPAKNGINKTIGISVARDGNESDLSAYRRGNRLEVAGTLILKKRDERLYLNLSASGVNFATTEDRDFIKGKMEFRGKVGKTIDERKDRNGKDYLQFSAFSAEKVGDGFSYIWVRFFRFGGARESWLQPGTRVETKGELELSVYNDNLSLSCKADELAEYVKPPYPANN